MPITSKKKKPKPIKVPAVAMHKKYRGSEPNLKDTERRLELEVRDTINKFTGQAIANHFKAGWKILIPIVSECYKKAEKTKFQVTDSLWRKFHIAVAKNLLINECEHAIKENNTRPMVIAIYEYVKWFNNKKK